MEATPSNGITSTLPQRLPRLRWLWFAVPALMMVGVWIFLTVNVPYWDDYTAILQYLVKSWPVRWTDGLFAFHNEHRIVFVRLVADAIVALNGGRLNLRAMMAVGNLIQLAYAVGWVLVFRNSKSGIWASVPVFWLLTAFIHYENCCWALTSVQNVAVVAFTFAACLAFAHWRENRRMPIVALSCAVAATYTSGGGMLVWPCLIAFLVLEPLNRSGTWKAGFVNLRENFFDALPRLIVMAIVAAAAICLYLRGFPAATGEYANAGMINRAINGILFLLAFLGGVVPVYPAALGLGTVSLAMLVYLAFNYPKIRRPEIFWFIIAEFLTMCSAALFRSADPHAAVSSRYCIVSCSVFAGLWYLGLELLPLSATLARRIMRCVAVGAAIYSAAFLVLGAPLFARRNEIMRRNLLTWKTRCDGLRSPNPQAAQQILTLCWKNGLYDPDSVLKPDEKPPSEPVEWLR